MRFFTPLLHGHKIAEVTSCECVKCNSAECWCIGAVINLMNRSKVSRHETLLDIFNFHLSLYTKEQNIQQESLMAKRSSNIKILTVVQLNKYETALEFIYSSQNLTSDCLLIFGLYPIFTWIYQNLPDLNLKLF